MNNNKEQHHRGRADNSTRYINGKLFMLAGRFTGIDSKESAQKEAQSFRKQNRLARVIELGFWDYGIYIF